MSTKISMDKDVIHFIFQNEQSSPVLVNVKREKDLIVETDKLLASLNVTTTVGKFQLIITIILLFCCAI